MVCRKGNVVLGVHFCGKENKRGDVKCFLVPALCRARHTPKPSFLWPGGADLHYGWLDRKSSPARPAEGRNKAILSDP